MGNIFERAPDDEVTEMEQNTDATPRVHGLGREGLPPKNPVVSIVRGVGHRGAGEDRPVSRNRSHDPRGESPAVLQKLGTVAEVQALENTALVNSRQGQMEQNSLRKSRRIAF